MTQTSKSKIGRRNHINKSGNFIYFNIQFKHYITSSPLPHINTLLHKSTLLRRKLEIKFFLMEEYKVYISKLIPLQK